MIIFYGDNFELNLTGTNITLVEENPLFFNYFVKNYSWPFTKKADDETIKKLGFLNLENIGGYTTKYFGKLLIDNQFEEAYFMLTDYKNENLEGVIYYGKASITLLDTPLNEIPFPVIATDSLAVHAKETMGKQYPEVDYNFPMVINDEFSSTNKYDYFLGIINNYQNDNFVTNSNQTIDGELVAQNKNLLVPYPYLMAVLKTGFESADMVMQGSFVSDRVNDKLLLYTDKFLEKFYSGLPEDFQLNNTNEVWQNGVVTANYTKIYNLSQLGAINVAFYLNIPSDIKVHEFTITHNSNIIFTSTANVIDKNIIVNLKESADLGNLHFSLQLRKTTANPSNGIGSIKAYNNFSFDFSDGELNIFPPSFSLAEIMPDITFGKLLNKIKNWLNLEIILEKNVATINYIEDKFLDTIFKDERHLEILHPHKKFNQNKLYHLFNTNDALFISKDGLVNSKIGYREEDITPINTDVNIMAIQAKDDVFTAYKSPDSDGCKLMLYDGLQNNLPVAVASVSGRNFSLSEIYTRNWKNWLFFRLNSETFKDKFKVDTLEQFDIRAGRFKYNRKHIYKKISRRRTSEEEWEIEIESETLP